MAYFFFYHLLKITCHLYFKKIRVYHKDHIHPNQPLIICANHGNSFMDAILMAIIFKRKMHFLARADAFNTPFKKWFLSKINMMPIYRIRDGREEVKNNDVIFDKCQKILAENGAILIFPEGNCVVEKRLRTFKTGFVQLAYESNVTNLQVLPVSINYSNPYAFYTEVSFEFAKPVMIEPLKLEKDYIQFSKHLLEIVQQRIAEHMIIIPSKEDELFYEELLLIVRNDATSDLDSIFSQLKTSQSLNKIKGDNSLLFNDLKEKTERYFKLVNDYQVSDLIIKRNITSSEKTALKLLYPIYVSGHLIHYIPLYLLQHQIKNKIKEPQFLSAVSMVAGMFLYLIYIPILIVILSLLTGSWLWVMMILFLVLFVHYLTFEKYEALKESQQVTFMPEKFEDLQKKRSEITSAINLLP